MFVNEYVMTRKRYDKWAAPKFWRLPIFYVYCIIFAAGTFGWIYFHHVGASLRWQSVGATLSFIAIYRGVFFKWMHADKTFTHEIFVPGKAAGDHHKRGKQTGGKPHIF